MRQGTLFSIQYLRGIAALIVALYHLEPRLNFFPETISVPYPILKYIGFLGVDLFFVISGFVIWLTSRKINSGHQKNHPRIRTFLIKRCCRIYSLYLLIVLSVFPAMYIIGVNKLPPLSILDFIKVLTLFPFPIDKHPLSVSWTLTFEMIFYLAFTLLLFVSNLRTRLGILGAGALIIFGLNCYLTFGCGLEFHEYYLAFPSFFGLSTFALFYLIAPYLLEFFLGVLACQFYLQNKDHTLPQFLSWSGYLLLTACCLFLVINRIDLNFYPFIRVLIFGPLFSLVLYLCVVKESVHSQQRTPNRILLMLGDASYSIYLLHTIAYSFLKYGTPFFRITEARGWTGFCLTALMFILMLAACVLYSRFIEIPLYEWMIKKRAQSKFQHTTYS